MNMTSSAWRVFAVGAIAMVLLSCSSNTTPGATTQASPATSSAAERVDKSEPLTVPDSRGSEPVRSDDKSAPYPANKEVTDRSRTALTEVGAQRLVMKPGYGHEVNTAFEGVWRGHPLIAYVVPTSALPSASELIFVDRRHIKGQAVDVVHGEDSTTRMLRFALGPDTWLLASRNRMTMSVALVEALLS